MSIILIATVSPLPEHRDEVIAIFEKAIEAVHAAEDGCLLYALHEARNGDLVMIEKYADQAAVDAHRSGAGVAGLMADLRGKLEGPMDLRFLTPHPAGDPDKGAL